MEKKKEMCVILLHIIIKNSLDFLTSLSLNKLKENNLFIVIFSYAIFLANRSHR